MDNNSKTEEEVNLSIIFDKIKQTFSAIGQTFINFFLFIKRKIGFLTVFSVLGILIGVGLTCIMKPIYISYLTVSSTTLNNQFCYDMVNELNQMVKDDAPELLAKELKVDISLAKEIKKIEFLNYNDKLAKKYEDKDTVVLGLPFKIKASVSNIAIFDTLQKALVNYFENNEYSLKRKAIKKENLKLMQQKLVNEIHLLDSLKFIVASNLLPRGNTSGFVFGQPIDPVNIYKEGITLFQENLTINSDLILSENIQVIQSFTPRKKPDSPRLFLNIALCTSMTFLLGLIIAAYKEKRKTIV